ncbi:MAG: hypothetical protein IJL52_01030 [Clostridia bacterium]|nr:hypothetical protein [Clostridia bacterium]
MSYCRQCGTLLTPENTRTVDGRIYCADCAAKLEGTRTDIIDFTAPTKTTANDGVTQAAFTPAAQPSQTYAPPVSTVYTPPMQPAQHPVYATPPMRRMRIAKPNGWAKLVRGMAIAMMVIGVALSVIFGIMVIAGGAFAADFARELGGEYAFASAATGTLSGILIIIVGSAISILSQATIMMITTAVLDLSEIKQEIMTLNDKQP